MNLPQKYVEQPEIALSQSMASMHMHPEMLRDRLPKDIDLWIQIDAGWHFSVRPPAKCSILIETDPHVLKRWYDLPKSYSDFTFCMQSNYMEKDEIYLPYAHDPTVHYPEQREKEYDVCLVGLLYPQRAALIDKLRADGLSVFYDIGLIFDEYREVYNKSRIALSWSTLDDLPARVWEGMAMGNLVVTNRVPDLKHFFVENMDYLGFDTIEEGEQQILNAMMDEELCRSISKNGCKTVQPETYDKRIQTILETVGLA
jgi:spore maturation protein CgeB